LKLLDDFWFLAEVRLSLYTIDFVPDTAMTEHQEDSFFKVLLFLELVLQAVDLWPIMRYLRFVLYECLTLVYEVCCLG
jgi:hypothetical protein